MEEGGAYPYENPKGKKVVSLRKGGGNLLKGKVYSIFK